MDPQGYQHGAKVAPTWNRNGSKTVPKRDNKEPSENINLRQEAATKNKRNSKEPTQNTTLGRKQPKTRE
jgi:hypothetical protein